MASTITALTGGGGVAVAGDTSGVLELQTNNGTTAMTIDTSQNVGIGTGSPAQKLDVASKIQIDTSNSYGKIKIARATDSGVSALYIQGADNAGTANELSLVNAGGGGAAINITGGDIRFYATSNTTERMRITSGGDLLLNQTANNNSGSIAVTFDTTTKNAIVIQDTSTTYSTTRYYQWFLNSTGGTAGSIAHTAATTVAFQTTSDRRLKENIVNAPYVLDKVTNIKVRSFDWKQDGSHVDYGFIAQELYDIAPEVVGKGDDTDVINDQKGIWQVDYGRLTPMLIKAIQELKAELDTVKAELAVLKGVA